MSRKLAHIEIIKSIEPIDGADKIELCKLLDWQVVVAKKDEFKVGEFVIYIEIDSLCDVSKPEFEFLKERKGRVRTIKLRKVLSQGLVLPISILPSAKYKEGQDVTDLLGITHFDPESPLNAKNQLANKTLMHKIIRYLCRYSLGRKLILPFIRKEKGAWPDYISHTDEESAQNIFGKVYHNYKDETFYVTEKIDYQSFTAFIRTVGKDYFGFKFKKRIFCVCSRTQWIKTPDNSLWWKNARKYNLESILRSIPEDLTIQGESGSTNVQGNKYKIKEDTLWVFNIINNKTGYHFSLEEMESFCLKHKLNFVPVLDRQFKLPDNVQDLLKYSNGKSVLNNEVIREGVVIRLIKNGEKLVSFKVRNPEFLLKYDE